MLIHEAVGKALTAKGAIYRESWPFHARLFPKHSKDPVEVKTMNHPPARSWNPTPEDLMADDWIVTKEESI